jgi:hypothetical protein
MSGFQKTGQVAENVTPCEICGHPSDQVINGKALCRLHCSQDLGLRPTVTDNIKKASELLTEQP